jgi:hypothetical protein
MPAEAVWESRLVGSWIVANSPPSLELGASVEEGQLRRFLARNGYEGAPMGERITSHAA